MSVAKQEPIQTQLLVKVIWNLTADAFKVDFIVLETLDVLFVLMPQVELRMQITSLFAREQSNQVINVSLNNVARIDLPQIVPLVLVIFNSRSSVSLVDNFALTIVDARAALIH